MKNFDLCDMHCHLVPGVDDGSRSMEESISLLRLEYEDGVRHIIVTPHNRRGMFEAPPEKIRESYLALKQEAAGIFPDLDLYLGCEYHVRLSMAEEIAENPLFRMGGSFYVLLEFSSQHSAQEIFSGANDILQNGYTPIIAHIERYPSVQKHPDIAEALKRGGAMIQINADSFLGLEGMTQRRLAKKLLKNDLVDFVGSDAHNMKDRKPRLGICAEKIEKEISRETARRVLSENTLRLIREIQKTAEGQSTEKGKPKEKEGKSTGQKRHKPVFIEEPDV